MSLILIMGIPASGKSTFRRKMEKSAPDLIVSTSFDEYREKHSLENARQTRKSFQLHVKSELSQNSRPIWLIEDIFYLQSMRRPFQKMAKRHGLQFGVVLMKADVEDAIGRNMKRREGRQTEETIWKVFEAMEEPVEVENRVVLEDTEDVRGIQDLLRILKMKLEMRRENEKVPDSHVLLESPESTQQNPLESLDVLTRRIVSEVMKSGGFDGRKLSEARKRLLHILSMQIQNPQDLPYHPPPNSPSICPISLQNQLIDIYKSL